MILLTGATGFVGSRLLQALLDQGSRVVCLVRDPSKIKKQNNLTIIKADLEHSDILSDSSDFQLLKEVKVVVHLAAIYDLKADSSSCYLANVVATMNLAVLVKKLPLFKKFIFMSTVAVAGNHKGQVPIDTVDFDQGFPNDYAKTKAQAEGFLRRSIDSSSLCILRSGIIIGDSKDMSDFKPDGPYIAIKYISDLFKKLPFIKIAPFLVLPINPKSRLPLVTIDVVVNSSLEAINKDYSGCHHLVLADYPLVLEFTKDLLISLHIKSKLKAISIKESHLNRFKSFPLPDSFPTELVDYMIMSPVYDLESEKNHFKALKDVSWSEIKEAFFRQAIKNIN
tara:strand:+ start:103 stop:1116 length:1014 start_codon:yes stop_codon:yes gene_type:complete